MVSSPCPPSPPERLASTGQRLYHPLMLCREITESSDAGTSIQVVIPAKAGTQAATGSPLSAGMATRSAAFGIIAAVIPGKALVAMEHHHPTPNSGEPTQGPEGEANRDQLSIHCHRLEAQP